jgi:hypothetical protein
MSPLCLARFKEFTGEWLPAFQVHNHDPIRAHDLRL